MRVKVPGGPLGIPASLFLYAFVPSCLSKFEVVPEFNNFRGVLTSFSLGFSVWVILILKQSPQPGLSAQNITLKIKTEDNPGNRIYHILRTCSDYLYMDG